jgi:hypothetical protein
LTLRVSRGWVALAAALCLATACTSGGAKPHPSATTPLPTPTTSATTPAGEAVAHLASLADKARYRATYVARQHKPRSRATWHVWHARSALRVDVVEGKVTATLIVTRRAAYSCSRAHHRRTCFRVAHGGKPIPAPFNLAPQALFTSTVRSLSTAADSYRVRAVDAQDGGPARPAATCYSIRATHKSPKPTVATGIYCFAATGIVTSVRYPSGNTVLLTQVRMRAPQPASFRPYSSPTPLPG